MEAVWRHELRRMCPAGSQHYGIPMRNDCVCSRIAMRRCVTGRPPCGGFDVTKWHETLAANIGLRAGGLVVLGFGWLAGAELYHVGQSHGHRDASAIELLLAAAAFLCASAGCALLFVGPGLWEEVRISERWATRLPVSRALEPEFYHDQATPGDHMTQQDRVSPHDGESPPIRNPHLSTARRG